MEKKELRFKLGCPVKIELIEAANPQFCRFGYKVGDSWDVSIWESSDLCGLAYHNFFHDIAMFQSEGEAFYKPQGERDKLVRLCPDTRAGLKFLIRKDK